MYKSPINIIVNDIVKSLEEKQENYVMEYVQNIGVDVDKDELIRALQYDRKQYEHGYMDGLNANKWIPVSERLPEKMQNVLFTTKAGNVHQGIYDADANWYSRILSTWLYFDSVIAWMPLPEPFKAESEE